MRPQSLQVRRSTSELTQVFEASYFDNELKLVEKATEIVDAFNDLQLIKETIFITEPAIWVFYKGSQFQGQRVMVSNRTAEG